MSMGVYIKGMEMPKEGSWTTVRVYPDGTCAVPNWQGDCTLIKGTKAVSVPPHGKLIDADAILQEATKGEEPFDWIDKNELLRLFFDAPTIIPYEQSKNEPTEDDLMEFEAEALGYRRFGMAEEGET